MDKKPDVFVVLEITKIKERIKQLYETLDHYSQELLDEFGEGRFDYDLAGVAKDDPFVDDLRERGQYLKFEITDNLRKMKDEGKIFTNATFSATAISTRSLKRKPKSLS